MYSTIIEVNLQVETFSLLTMPKSWESILGAAEGKYG